MSDLLKYLEQVGRTVTGSEVPSRPEFTPFVEQQVPTRQETPEESAQRIQTGIQDAPELITKRSGFEAATDIASSVASGVYGTAVGGTSLFLNPDQINAMRVPLEALQNMKSPQAKAQLEAYNRETAQFNRTIENAIMNGEISSFDGQVAIAKNSFSSMNASAVENAMAEGAGSVAFLIGMSAFGPVGAAAGWGAMGASTLASPVDGVLRELYAEVMPGQYKYTHDDLIDSSPIYQRVYERTKNEEEARRAVFNEGRKIAVMSPENIAGTLIELAGERLLLRMSGTLKTAREMGGVLSVPGNLAKSTAGETAAEVSGDFLSTVASNRAISETFDEDRDALAGTGAGVPQAAIGAVGGVGVTVPGAVLTGVSNTLSNRAEEKSVGNQSDRLNREIDSVTSTGSETEGGNPADPADETVSRLRAVQDLYNTGGGKELPESLRELAGAENSRVRQIVALYEHVTSGKASPEETIEIGRVLQEYSQDLDAATNALGDPDQIENADHARVVKAAIGNRDRILNDSKGMQAAVEKATELVASREIERDESGNITEAGNKTVSSKLALAPETLTADVIDSVLDNLPNMENQSFSEPEIEKLRFIRETLNKQRELDQQRADAGMSQPVDVVGREVLSEYGEGTKGKSVLGHATSIMDSMRAGRKADAKAQAGTLRRFIQSHTNKLKALEQAVASGQTTATYRTYNQKQRKGVNTTIEVKGQAQNLRRAVAQELAFMEDVYNRLVDTYGELGSPIQPNPQVNAPFSGSKGNPDTRTSQQKVTESGKSKTVVRHTPESAQQLSSTDLYRQANNLSALSSRDFNQNANLRVLKDEIARREKAVEDSVRSIEEVEAMSRTEQQQYLSGLRAIPATARSEEMANHVAQVTEILNRPAAERTETTEAAPAPEVTPAPAAQPEPEATQNPLAEPIERVKAKFAQLDLESSERLISSLGSSFITSLYDGSISQGELAMLEQRIDAYLNRPTPPTPPRRSTRDTTSAGQTTPAPVAPSAPSQPNTRAEAEDTINVWYGSNENAELSNLAERPFRFNGVDYLSVEHAYQSLKSGEFDQATYNKYTAGNQKIAGRKGTKTEGNWNLFLMRDLVLESFKQNPEAREALLATGDAKFSHTQDRGVWKTEFPRILESVRRTLRKASDTAPTAESQNESQITQGLEGSAPERSSPSFLAPIEDAAESFKSITPLVGEMDAVEQTIENTTDDDARIELEERAENLAEAIAENVDRIVEQLIDQLDDLPEQVADVIRDELFDLRDSDDIAIERLRGLSDVLREARNIANSTGDLFGNSTPQQNEDTAQASQSESSAVAKKIFANARITKAVNIAADKTRIYTEKFLSNLVQAFRNATDAPTRTYGDFLVQQRNRISTMLGSYDEVGNPTAGSILSRIHTAMDNQLIYNLDSSPSKVKILEDLLRPYIGKESITDWMSRNFPKPPNTNKGREQGRKQATNAIRSVLSQHMDEVGVDRLFNKFKADILARNRTHRMLDLMTYDPDANTFTLSSQVMNAAALALTDYIGNFRNFAETYQEPGEIAKALGVVESGALVTQFEGESGTLSVEQLSTMGYTTFRRAVAQVTGIAYDMLGMRGKSTAGEGDIRSPMSNFIGTLMENITESTETSFVSVSVTNDNGVTFPILIPLAPPDEGTSLSNLALAGDLGSVSTLVEPDRVRYIEEVPQRKTTDKQGNRLTKNQQDAAEAANSVEYRANPGIFNLFTTVLGRTGMLQAFGNPEALNENVPMSRLDRESKNGLNIQVINALQELGGLAHEIVTRGSNLFDTAVHYAHTYSSVTRLMMTGGYNPQADKVIRAVMSPHRAVIDASNFIEHLDSGSMDSASTPDRFLTLAYAQAFGVSIQNRSMEQIREDLKEILDSDMRGIAQEWANASTQTAEADLAGLIERTKAKLGGDFSALGVQALVEVGSILSGNNTSQFTTHAYVEADGITNGPFMAGMMLGIQDFSSDWVRFTANGGLYIGREETSNDYRSGQIADPEASKPDNYSAVTQEANVLIDQVLRGIFDAGNEGAKSAIQAIRTLFKHGMSSPVINAEGQVEVSRSVGKNPVTVTFYGSGVAGIASKFAGEIAQGIYEIATAALQSKDLNELADRVIKGDLTAEQKLKALEDLLKAYDTLTGGRLGTKDEKPVFFRNTRYSLNILGRFKSDKESLVDLRLSKQQLENLTSNLKGTLAKPLVDSLTDLAGSTLEGTEVVQRSTSAFSDLLAAVFQKEIKLLTSNPDFDPTVGLSRKQIRDVIQKLKSFGITDTIGDSMFSLITQEGAIPGLEIPLDTIQGSGLHHMESTYKNLTNIGVGGIPRFIISRGDGATIIEFFNRAVKAGVDTALAIFDGINFGIKDFEKGGKLANEAALHSIMQNPVLGLLNQIEKGMYPMLEELGFDIGPDSSVSVTNGKEIEDLVDSLATAIGSTEIAENIVLSGLKNALPGLAQDENVTLADFKDVEFDSPIILVPRIARNLQDLKKMINSNTELEMWKSIHPFMRVFEDVDHLKGLKSKYDGLYLEHPEGVNSVFSTASLKRLANRVTENLDVLKQFKFSIDQYAGGGHPAVNEGIELGTKNFDEIAEALQAEARKKREDKHTNITEQMFRLNMKHWEKGDNGILILKDFKGFRKLFATSFPKGDLRNNVANRVARLIEIMGVEVVIDPNAPGAQYSSTLNRVTLVNTSSVAALHEMIHGAITQTIHDKYFLNKKMRPAVENAFADLEAIMSELFNDPSAVTSVLWKRALTHMTRAGNKTRATHGPRAATGSMINEMLAIWLTQPALAADAMSRPPKSRLRKLGDSILKMMRAVFNLDSSDPVDSLFMRMTYSVNTLAMNTIKGNNINEGSPEVLDMFDPNDVGMSQPAYREFVDIINQAESLLREADKDLTLKRDLESVDSAEIFTANGFYMNDAEQRAFNQIREVFAVSSKLNPEVKSNLYRLAAHVFRNIKPEHFGDTSQVGTPSYHVAYNKHAAVTGSASGSREAMVINLIALASVNPEMKEVLNQIGLPRGEKSTETESTWERVLGQAGYDAMNMLSNYLSGARKNEVPSDLLSRLLESVEKKPQGESNKVWTLPGQTIDKVNEKTSDLLTSMGNFVGDKGQDLIRNSNNRATTISGGILGAVGAALSKDSAMGFAEQMNTVLNGVENFNFLKDSFRDIIGRTDLNASVYDLIKVVRSHVQRLRQMYIEGVEGNIKKRFKTQPTQDQMNALQRTLADTDVAAVVGSIGIDAAIDTLSSDAKVARRISRLESIINQEADAQFYLEKARQLAHYLNTGETGSLLLLNASHIAGKFGYDGAVPLEQVDAGLANVIDEYVSLLAFEGSNKEAFREMLNSEPDAIRYIMAIQDGIRKDELNKPGTFGKPVGIKGFIPASSAGSIKIIRDDMAQQYVNRGYVRVGDYQSTIYDNRRISRGYYINPMDENRPFAQGIIQNVVQSVNGLTINDEPLSENLLSTGFDIETIESIVQDGIASSEPFGLVPIFDDQGNVVNLVRAIDPAVAREKNSGNDFAANLGRWRGRQIEENTAENINKVIVDELERAYENDTKKGEYVDLLSMDSSDPVIKDALSILNRDATRYSKDTYGRMMVRKELLNNVIGYRQAGVADIWNGISRFSPETRRGIQRALEAMIGPKAFKYMVAGEDILRGVVADAKQLIVVKSVVIPAVNGLSNIIHMMARGVPLASIAKSAPRKLAEIEQYSQGMKRVIEIESEILATSEPALVRRLEAERSSILEHQKSMSIYPLIESGEFSSIVSVQIDQESSDLNKGRVAEYLENKINGLPPAGRTLANNVLISRNTAIYQFLQKSVDYGDFIAKAIIYDDITQRQKKSSQYALGRIKEEFVNYDYLPGRTRGALEANGLLWFFNFKMRSLKIALSMVRENPVTALLTVGAVPMSTPFGNLGLPLDDNILSQSVTGAAGYSVGPQMGMNAASLHPLAAIVF